MKRSFLPLLVFLFTAHAAWGQTTERARDRYQIKIGTSFDRGDYGSAETTKILFVPITFRYLGEKYDLSVTPSFARVNTAGGVRFIDGVPVATGGPSTVRDTQSAPGDTVIRSRYFLLEGTKSLPSITPFAKVKLPTAKDDLNIGTGKTDVGFGVEVDQQVARTLLFGDLGYTVIGKPPTLNLRNRVAASFGVGEKLSDSVVLSGMLDWSRALVTGAADPAELVGVLTYRASRAVTLSPNVYIGLTESSTDFGAGVELSVRFGRR